MIVILDYGTGNLGSIANMLKKVGAKAEISSDPQCLMAAEKLILPGVGAFDHGMARLNDAGLVPVLNDLVLNRKVPVLGLCLGFQLMTKGSEEGQLSGLGWLDAVTVRFKFDPDLVLLKVPHMGWNNLRICRPHPLLEHIGEESRFYFVHSYHVVLNEENDVLAYTDYGHPVTAMAARGNILGAQFHPEKSHRFGMQLLRNFSENF